MHHGSSALSNGCTRAPADIFSNTLSVPPPQVGLSSFQQRAIHFLCEDLKWARQIWNSFSVASPDLKLSLVTWVVDGRGSQQTSLKEVIRRVLQVRQDMFPRPQHAENKLFKNLFNSFQYINLLRAQCEEIEEAKIGLNVMPWENWIWMEISFSLLQKKGCVFKLLCSVIEETEVQSSRGYLFFYCLLCWCSDRSFGKTLRHVTLSRPPMCILSSVISSFSRTGESN